jgi:hypothetical protein
MYMTSKEIVRNTIAFNGAIRMPYSFDVTRGGDIFTLSMTRSPDTRPREGVDEWGSVWENIGICNLGEVKKPALPTWDLMDTINIPDVAAAWRWDGIEDRAREAGDRYILGSGVSLYERVHFLRGFENTWMDIYDEPDKLRHLIKILVNQNKYIIQRYRQLGVDGYFWWDDWGLQNRLMISPEKWREFWEPAYREVYEAAHSAGMQTFLHSCGYIVDILDDLIDAGLDVIQMDQQENMTLDLLSKRFRGRITFWNPVDIQVTMHHGTTDEIRQYARTMVQKLGTSKGGFIAKQYGDIKGAGHRTEAVEAMCDEFLEISTDYQSVVLQ